MKFVQTSTDTTDNVQVIAAIRTTGMTFDLDTTHESSPTSTE